MACLPNLFRSFSVIIVARRTERWTVLSYEPSLNSICCSHDVAFPRVIIAKSCFLTSTFEVVLHILVYYSAAFVPVPLL